MADPFSLTTGVLSALALALKLVVGAIGMVDKTKSAHLELLDKLKLLQSELEDLRTQTKQVHVKLRAFASSTKDRAFKRLLQKCVPGDLTSG